MAVRSKRLFGPVEVGATGSVVYTAPAGETALVKHLEVGAGGATGTVVSFYKGLAAAANRLRVESLATGEWRSSPGLFIVLQPGDALRVQTSAGNVTVSGFGAELEGVAD